MNPSEEITIVIKSGNKEWELSNTYKPYSIFKLRPKEFKILLNHIKTELASLQNAYQSSKRFKVDVSNYKHRLCEELKRDVHNFDLNYGVYFENNPKYYNNIFKAIRKAKKTPLSDVKDMRTETVVWKWIKTSLEQKLIGEKDNNILSVVINEMHKDSATADAFSSGLTTTREGFLLISIVFSDGTVYVDGANTFGSTQKEIVEKVIAIAKNETILNH